MNNRPPYGVKLQAIDHFCMGAGFKLSSAVIRIGSSSPIERQLLIAEELGLALSLDTD
jgi:hypothetical protein